MPTTPPRVSSTFAPLPIGRIRLSTSYTDASGPVAVEPCIDVLTFGRSLDASIRDDTDFFVSEDSPARRRLFATARSLARAIAPLGDPYSHLVFSFAREDPVEIGVGLENLRRVLAAADRAERTGLATSLRLGSHLVASFSPEPDLGEAAIARILTYAALEAYYYKRATSEAKRQFDAFRILVRLATGRTEDAINQDEDLGNGLHVWEGWQAVRCLESFFDLAELGDAFTRKDAPALAALFYAASAIRAASVARIDTRAVERALSELERIAKAGGRVADLRLVKPFLGFLRDAAGTREAVAPPDVLDLGVKTPEPAMRPALSPELRRTFDPETEDERRDRREYRSRHRTAAAIVEDLTSVVERIDILLHGDDNSLVFEISPILVRQLRAVYYELALDHPELEAAVYELGRAEPPPSRELALLRALVERAGALVAGFRAVLDALGTGGMAIGYITDLAPPPLGAPPPAEPSPEPAPRAPPRDPLEDVDLASSRITAVRSTADSVTLELVFNLPARGLHTRGRLVVAGARSITWRRINLEPRVGPDGTVGLGTVEVLRTGPAATVLAGAWGEVALEGAAMRVELDE